MFREMRGRIRRVGESARAYNRSVIEPIGRSALPPADVCQRALNARDARFDGLFFVDIVTTGV